MIGYKCGAENTGESSLLPHTVGYVHSEYLLVHSSTGYKQKESLRTTAQPRSPFWLLLQMFNY